MFRFTVLNSDLSDVTSDLGSKSSASAVTGNDAFTKINTLSTSKQNTLSITEIGTLTNWNCDTLNGQCFRYGNIALIIGEFKPKQTATTALVSLFALPYTVHSLYDSFFGYCLDYDNKTIIPMKYVSSYNVIQSLVNLTATHTYTFYWVLLVD